MNRRRIGLAGLVVGAGAVVRHRLKTQLDAGPDRDDAASSPPAQSDRTSAGSAAADAAPEQSSESAARTTPVADGAPNDVSGPRSSADLIAQAAASAGSRSDVQAQAQSVSAEIASVSIGDPQVSASDVDADPVITLPTMPPAGTPEGLSPRAGLDTQQHRPRYTDPASPAIDSPPDAPPPITLPLASAAAPTTAAVTAPPAAGAAVEPTPVVSDHDPVAVPAVAPADVANTQGNGTPPRKQPFHKAHRGWSIVGSILLGLAVVAVIAGSVIRLPYYSLQPGSVYDTIERVEAPGDLVSIPGGEIGFVTVAQTANITPWQWLDAKLDNNVRIRHEDEVRGDQTADELREADIRRMQVSKNSAVVVALNKLGFDLIITPIGIEVAQVFDCTAADGVLGTGDLIVGVNGVDVRSGEELVNQLMGQTIGAEVDLLVERIDPNNPTQSIGTDLVGITLGSADASCLPDDVRAEEPRPFIGIGTLPMFDEEFPIDIDVRTGSVSGPSAGLAFTLAIMDVLSEGELTNELSVVATGTIDRDGNVGPVGGIHQKTIAAERSGADVFLVPKCCDNFVSRDDGEPLDIPSNYEEALLYADDMIVIGVDTIDEALIALGELGGDVDAFLDQTTP